MADIYEWLENMDRTLGAPSEPVDGDLFAGVPMDEIMPLDLDKNGNRYFEYPPIVPSLYTMTGPSAPATLGQSIVTVPEEFAEASSKLLVYLIRTHEIPEVTNVDEESTERMTFTAEELEILESITEEEFEPSIPSAIDGVRVNTNPKLGKIKEIIDLRHIGPHRRTFYLARTIGGAYY